MTIFRALVIVLIAFAGITGASARQDSAVPGKGVAGHWQGTLKATPVIELRLVLEIVNTNGILSAVMTSIDQGGAKMPVAAVTEDQGTVRLELRNIGATFTGRMNADGSEMSGEWQQGGNKLPLAFKRLAAAPSFARPQDPKPPLSYDTEDVTFANPTSNITLAGTFTRPRGAGPHPAVVLISGSGPQDRDEALMGHRPFLVLADHLTRQGIAVLRYDDRGVGKSTGNFRVATHEDFVTDALAAVNWLKAQKQVDPSRIGLVGHSEGGLAAPLAAVKQPRDIAFLVLLAGPGMPMDELLVRQGRDLGRVMGMSPEMIETSAASQREVFALLKEKLDPPAMEKKLREMALKQVASLSDEQRKAMGYTDAMMENQLQQVMTPWFRALIVYDPRPALRQVTQPVLAINGGNDVQVAAAENLAAIREALAAGGNKDVTIQEFPALNHLFQMSKTGAVAEYGQIEETFNPAALTVISDWIRRRTGLN